MRIFSYIVILIIVIFGISFATLNSDPVNINYYLDTSRMPLSLVLVLAFALGCILGMAVCMWLLIKAKMHHYRLQQRLVMAEKEIENLRAIPLQDQV